MELYLIRHGKTKASEKRLYCGSTDLPLSRGGREELVQRDYRLPPELSLWTSGMRRCQETLDLVVPGHGEHRVDRDFREIDFGVFEMHSYQALKDRPDYQAWLAGDPQKKAPPGGEAGRDFAKRVWKAFERLAARGEDALLITHGGVIATVMAGLFPEEARNHYQWQPLPGQGYVLRKSPEGWAYQAIGDMESEERRRV